MHIHLKEIHTQTNTHSDTVKKIQLTYINNKKKVMYSV